MKRMLLMIAFVFILATPMAFADVNVENLSDTDLEILDEFYFDRVQENPSQFGVVTEDKYDELWKEFRSYKEHHPESNDNDHSLRYIAIGVLVLLGLWLIEKLYRQKNRK